jgi:hypothetical protein
MRRIRPVTVALAALTLTTMLVALACSSGGGSKGSPSPTPTSVDPVVADAAAMIDEGRQTFRFDTFGDEDFWTNTLKLNQAIAGSAHGGVGAGLTPVAALGAGLKVDMDALPADLVAAIQAGQVDLNDPATTLALLKLNAVVGVTGVVDSAGSGSLTSVGIQCALCHSTVDDAFAPGIGHRLDGWPNRDLNVGAIVNLSPDLSAVASLLGVSESTVRTVAQSWGPGKFDAELFMDGKAFRGDGGSGATLIPPAYGLAGVNLHTFTGWGSVTYWNAFVANLEMHGKGRFFDPRLANSAQFPVASSHGFDDVRPTEDRVTPKLAALHFYQLALKSPAPPAGSFDAAAAARGKDVFEGAGRCASCHVPPLFTEPGWNMHTPQEIGIDSFQSDRSPDKRYRTTPLKGLWAHSKGGYYHDGRFADLPAVIAHYDSAWNLALTPAQESDLAEYLKSL